MKEEIKTYTIESIKNKLKKLYKQNDWQEVVTETKFIEIFLDRHKNWIRGDKFLIHSGWYANFDVGILLEYEWIWNDKEFRQWL